MRALFVTSSTSDVDSLVRAWDCWQPDKSSRVTFHHMGTPNDDKILATARLMSPEIIFYIGACEAPGIPSIETFLALRDLAPLINLCCDAGDPPWHKPLRRYREVRCFDLHVGLDGCLDAPVDLVTVTPVDPFSYTQSVPRTIHCGFSGGLSSRDRLTFKTDFPNRAPPKITKARPANALPAWSPINKKRVMVPATGLPYTERDGLLWNLEDKEGLITIQRRTSERSYSEHSKFMLSCQIIFNTSRSGTGYVHQIKGRVLEAAWAGCALLETEGSPIATWMPQGSYFTYKDADDATHLIESLTTEQIAESASMLNEYVRKNYHPRQIYGEILERAGVDHSIAIPPT